MKTYLAFVLALTILGNANGQQATPMNVTVAFQGFSETAKKAVERYVSKGLETRGIHKLTDNALDPNGHLFDDSVWVDIKPVGSPELGSYALEIQFSIVQGVSVNNMLFRFQGSLIGSGDVRPGATPQEMNIALDKLLFSTLDRLMDEAKREFSSPTYRRGWHPTPVPHPIG